MQLFPSAEHLMSSTEGYFIKVHTSDQKRNTQSTEEAMGAYRLQYLFSERTPTPGQTYFPNRKFCTFSNGADYFHVQRTC